MNHPTPEEWMSFLYDETSKADRLRLQAHLGQCAHCSAEIRAWRKTMKDLDVSASVTPSRTGSLTPVVFQFARWAAAALLVMGIGFALGHASKARSDMAEWQRTILPSMRAQLQEDLLAALEVNGRRATNEFRRSLHHAVAQWSEAQQEAQRFETAEKMAVLVESLNSARAVDRQTIASFLHDLGQQNASAYSRLKQSLDTVAVVADNRLQQAEQQLGQLISHVTPVTP